MAEPIPNANIVGQGLGWLTSAYASQPNIRALLAVYLQPFQDVQNALYEVYVGRQLANATIYQLPETNAVLDVLGGIVGVKRQGLSDFQYLILIRVCALCNRSNGTMLNWSNIVGILQNSGASSGALTWEQGSRAFQLGLWDIQIPTQILAGMLSRARPTGIMGFLAYSTWSDGNDIGWSSVRDSTAGEAGWGSVSDSMAGGYMVAALQMLPAQGVMA